MTMRVGLLDFHMVNRSRPGTSGVSDMIWDLAQGLAACGDDVHITGAFTTKDFPVAGVKVHPYEIRNFWYRNALTQMLVIMKGGQALRKVRGLQILHVPEYLSSALLSFLVPGIPVILTTPGNIFERITRYNPYDLLTTFVYKWAARQSSKRCARIIATSKDMARWWEISGATTEKTVVIPLMVNTDLFFRNEGSRIQLGWSEKEQHLLFVGRLFKENRIELLVECMAELRNLTNRQVRLHVVGEGPLRIDNQTAAQQAGVADTITWHGGVDYKGLPNYYSAADILVFPRPTGAPPRVIPQAMACGTPVISVANENVKDYLRDGYTGAMANSVSGAALAVLIANAINNPGQLSIWQSESSNHARQYFAINAVTKRIREEVYQPLLQEHKLV
jgi:glycosyltransferase involved in cell wall biosynthesis